MCLAVTRIRYACKYLGMTLANRLTDQIHRKLMSREDTSLKSRDVPLHRYWWQCYLVPLEEVPTTRERIARDGTRRLEFLPEATVDLYPLDPEIFSRCM